MTKRNVATLTNNIFSSQLCIYLRAGRPANDPSLFGVVVPSLYFALCEGKRPFLLKDAARFFENIDNLYKTYTS